MKGQSIAEALREGIAEEMDRDPALFCMGEDFAVPGGWGGAFTVTLGLESHWPEGCWTSASSVRAVKLWAMLRTNTPWRDSMAVCIT